MKILNKLVLLSLVLFLSALCFMFFAYNKLTDGTAHGGSIQNKPDSSNAVEAESNISPPAESRPPVRQYVLKLEGDLICAYIIEENGIRHLWNSTSRPLSLSPDDVKKLENGLYTSGFEELCLFFEAYAS